MHKDIVICSKRREDQSELGMQQTEHELLMAAVDAARELRTEGRTEINRATL